MRIACLLCTLLIVLSVPVQAQTIVVRADRMLHVESGEMITPAVVVVEGGVIKSINPSQVPTGAEVVELGDVTLLPGFMDMHTHLTFDIEGDWVNDVVKKTAADQALRGARNARRTLMAGFTTVRNVGSGGFSGVALMHAIDDGLIEGPSVFPAAHSIGITGGHCDVTGFAPGVLELGPKDGIADGPDQVLTAVRYQIKQGAKVVKICATAGVLSFEGPVGAQQFSQEELKAIVEEATRHGVKVAAHAHGSEGILAAVKAGVASIEHGSILNDEIIAEMKARGTYLVPTSYLANVLDMEALPPPIRTKAEFVIPKMHISLRSAVAAGVKIALGTDAAVMPHGDNAYEFGAMVEHGMTPLQALQSGTINAADLLGVDDRGRIAVGYRADLAAVPGNPLNDIHVTERVAFVMKEGVVYKQQ